MSELDEKQLENLQNRRGEITLQCETAKAAANAARRAVVDGSGDVKAFTGAHAEYSGLTELLTEIDNQILKVERARDEAAERAKREAMKERLNQLLQDDENELQAITDEISALYKMLDSAIPSIAERQLAANHRAEAIASVRQALGQVVPPFPAQTPQRFAEMRAVFGDENSREYNLFSGAISSALNKIQEENNAQARR